MFQAECYGVCQESNGRFVLMQNGHLQKVRINLKNIALDLNHSSFDPYLAI